MHAEKDIQEGGGGSANDAFRRRGFSFRVNSTDDDDDDASSSGIGNMSGSGLFGSDEDESILGKVHLELCKYYEVGRFSDPDASDEFDEAAAFYHLQQAANLGVVDALTSIAKIYLQMPRDILPNYKVEVVELKLPVK